MGKGLYRTMGLGDPIGSLRNWHLRSPAFAGTHFGGAVTRPLLYISYPECSVTNAKAQAHQYAQQLRPQTPRSALLIIFCGVSFPPSTT